MHHASSSSSSSSLTVCQPPFPNTDLSFPRRATTISSRTRKTRKPARRRTRKRRRCTSRARNREVRRRRRRRRPECSARRASFWKGEFYSDFERKRDVGCTLSFFLSFFRSRAPGAKTRGLPDVLSILSFFLSLFLSLSPFSCCVRACFLCAPACARLDRASSAGAAGTAARRTQSSKDRCAVLGTRRRCRFVRLT